MADRLLFHLENCPVCQVDAVNRKRQYCAERNELTALTTAERHGLVTNNERRAALNKARAEALRHAVWAEETFPENTQQTWDHATMARTWAAVAEALKDGDPMHDAVIESTYP